MRKFNPTKLLFGFLGLATFASLVGSVSGSLAWYAYSTRASLSYTGTSIERTSQLQIGVVSANEINYSASEMVEDTTINDGEGNHYYFAPIGSGLTSSILEKYLDANGFATNYLIPATSGSYEIGDPLLLKKAPSLDTGYINNDDVALGPNYSYFKFVFRVAKNAYSTVAEYVSDHEVWLSDAQARASFANQGSVFKSLRIFIDRNDGYGNDYIFNPGATSAGETKVGGYAYEIVRGTHQPVHAGGLGGSPGFIETAETVLVDVRILLVGEQHLLHLAQYVPVILRSA